MLDGIITVLFLFQSTLPAWGATFNQFVADRIYTISIHAPRVGSDASRLLLRCRFAYFNPRSPRGERLRDASERKKHVEFQSTLPAWGATGPADGNGHRPGISIHAPRVGSDTRSMSSRAVDIFQSTLPAWGATDTLMSPKRTRSFQSTLPAWGATGIGIAAFRDFAISIHAPRVGSDISFFFFCLPPEGISIHAPRVGSDDV